MISSISAVVGGIVIMNVMLVSVTERTKEIGVRRAVGATQSDILHQFLTESVLQCLVGGGIGVWIGFACALALRQLTSFPASVQIWVALLGVFLSSLIGLFFGIYPAVKASKLDPVVALANGVMEGAYTIFAAETRRTRRKRGEDLVLVLLRASSVLSASPR